MNKARGMPSVALTPQTEELIKAEEVKEEENDKKLREDPFVKPNLDIKVIDTENDVGTIEQGTILPKPKEEPVISEAIKIKKPKKKLTEKQLEALKRGRVKSAETRKKNAELKKKAKEELKAPKNHIQTQNLMPQQQQAPTIINTPNIDYDRIINGVANMYQQQQFNNQQQQQKKNEVEFNVKEFEKKVRDEERLRVLGEIERLQKEEEMEQSQKVATQTLNKQPQSVNPFSYAFNMNSRSRYNRY